MQVAAEDGTSLGTELRSSAQQPVFLTSEPPSPVPGFKTYDVYFVLLSPTSFLQCVGIKAENLRLSFEISCVQGEEKDFF